MSGNRRNLERTIEDVDRYQSILTLLEATPSEMNHLHIPLVQDRLRSARRTLECVEKGEPFIAAWFTNAPEICAAMDLHWYCQLAGVFVSAIESPHAAEDLEGIDQLAVPADVCTLLRLGMYYIDAGLLPIPTAVIALIEPCDGVTSLHEAIRCHRDWRDVPMFAPDPPYYDDERSIEYFANELREMVVFLEEHTGHRLEMDRLREVVEESNRQYELWLEYSDLRRSIPCPHGVVLALSAFGVAQNNLCGTPTGTAWFRDLVADAERRIREGEPEVPDQKIRLLWNDIHPVWFDELTPWLEAEWGATVIQSMLTYCPYTLVDTSSEDSIWRGLAKRNLLDTPMIRQARGKVEGFVRDIGRIVEDFSIDCVIWPGHMGHKDSAASVSVMSETCREIGVPFLHIGVDQFDRRYTPVDEIKNRIAQFFRAMKIG
jgi:benzoyl-CoA reductase/2-hydroxyglutaryl-CoA dehydratase subunit BcrC/BadD/HgdB